MAITTVPNLGPDPFTVNASVLNGKVDPLVTDYNGNIDNTNIASAAAIANSKLNLASIAQNVAHSGTMTHAGATTMSAKDFTEAKSADIASATTTTIWATDGNYAHITGTTTITSFGTAEQAGDCRTVVFDGALTLTHNSTSLILPTGANITTAAGDTAIVRAETTANARVIAYLRKDGTPLVSGFTPSTSNALSGSLLQRQVGTVATVVTCSTAQVDDDTIPQNTEGDEVVTVSITPSNSSNTLNIRGSFSFGAAGAAAPIWSLFQDSTANALSAGYGSYVQTNEQGIVNFSHTMTAGTTSATTFKIRFGSSGTTMYVNAKQGTTNRSFGGVQKAVIEVLEFKA